MYDMNDGTHRFRDVDIDEGKVGWQQKGFREYLLCSVCEGKFSAYERYGAEFFRNLDGLNTVRHKKRRVVTGLDYSKMRMFFLSMLWRAGVASIDIFQHVKLGPHEAKLKEVLRGETSCENWQYPFLMCALTMRGKPWNGVLVEPTPTRLFGQRGYKFVFKGFLLFFFVSGRPLPDRILDYSLRPNGSLVILDFEADEVKFLRDLMQRVAKRFPGES